MYEASASRPSAPQAELLPQSPAGSSRSLVLPEVPSTSCVSLVCHIICNGAPLFLYGPAGARYLTTTDADGGGSDSVHRRHHQQHDQHYPIHQQEFKTKPSTLNASRYHPQCHKAGIPKS